jgi:hypothetical protein
LSTEIVSRNPAFRTSEQLSRRQVLHECRTAALFWLPGGYYPLSRLTNGLPGFVSPGDDAGAGGESHAGEPFAAHFRRTRRPQARASLTTKGHGVQSMTDMTATTTKDLTSRSKASDDHTALHLCYREIGISAVAAAARYHGEAKIPTLARVAVRADEHGAA